MIWKEKSNKKKGLCKKDKNKYQYLYVLQKMNTLKRKIGRKY